MYIQFFVLITIVVQYIDINYGLFDRRGRQVLHNGCPTQFGQSFIDLLYVNTVNLNKNIY